MYFLIWLNNLKTIALPHLSPGHSLPQSAEIFCSLSGECGLSTRTGLVERVENTDVILAQGQHSRGLYGVAENVASEMLPMFPRWFNDPETW